ncbi:hypothetical protein E4K67_29045 [Desulfosporosinus fructosivorans]|uniref:DUF11 domain-containing protein n=1 Tax=Desulfosporosinus fructosivorans TaxID=2018669 RepID=A0A4Z0QXQ0_9FIRM|nr:hypothetical protein [Desulfosporosinus fructosivorans]TGE34743.1 hypothetical protein E4K67_29045 [Desulfosporosinus fructosivorans]
MKTKQLSIILGLLLVMGICVYNYYHISTRSNEPFLIDFSKAIIEDTAPELLNTKQDYYFSLVNGSDKPIKLNNIELGDYSGIKVGELTFEDKPLNGLDVPSNKVYEKDGWHTEQGLDIHYTVTILKEKIINPKTATITYTTSGVVHKQIVKIVGI